MYCVKKISCSNNTDSVGKLSGNYCFHDSQLLMFPFQSTMLLLDCYGVSFNPWWEHVGLRTAHVMLQSHENCSDVQQNISIYWQPSTSHDGAPLGLEATDPACLLKCTKKRDIFPLFCIFVYIFRLCLAELAWWKLWMETCTKQLHTKHWARHSLRGYKGRVSDEIHSAASGWTSIEWTGHARVF